MFCPNARCPDYKRTGLPGEYIDGVTSCPYCGAELVGRRPCIEEQWAEEDNDATYTFDIAGVGEAYEPEREIVPIADYISDNDAGISLSFLVANGIEAYMMPDDRLKSSKNTTEVPARIVVAMSQANDAIFLLRDIYRMPDQLIEDKSVPATISGSPDKKKDAVEKFRTRCVSTAFTTNKIDETKDFYVRFLSADVTFDCGWYINLRFGEEKATLRFMSPRKSEQKPCMSTGLLYNFLVDDVDGEYDRITALGLTPTIPLQDQPWGERSFAIEDPNGITLYIYSEREPEDTYKQYYRD